MAYLWSQLQKLKLIQGESTWNFSSCRTFYDKIYEFYYSELCRETESEKEGGKERETEREEKGKTYEKIRGKGKERVGQTSIIMSLRSSNFYVTAPAKGCHAEDPERNVLHLM